MNDTDMLLAHEKRLTELEASMTRLSEMCGKAEDKASSAWKRINEVDISVRQLNDKVEQLRLSMDSRLDKLEQNMIHIANRVESMTNETQDYMDKMKKAFIIVGMCAVVALVYSIVQDKVTADSILNAVTSGAKVIM